MKNAVIKRVDEGKGIKEIGQELCDGLKYPKRKITEIIREIKGEAYLKENRKRLHYRGGGGAGKPKKHKKNQLQNFAAQAVPNLSESDKFKIKFTQLINECHDSQPNDWKEIILKCIEDFEESKALDKIMEIAQDKILKIYLPYAANWNEEAEYLLKTLDDPTTSSTATALEIPGLELKTVEKLFKFQQLYWAKRKELGLGRCLFSWDNIPGYLFCWDEIPEQDNGRLLGYIKQNYDINWVDTAAKIEKTDDRTIILSTEKNSLSLTLNDDKTKVKLKVDVGKTDEFIAKMENGKLNIYITENDVPRLIKFLSDKLVFDWVKTAKIEKTDDRTIIVSNENDSLSLTLNDDKSKVKLEIIGGRFAEFNAMTVNGKLNIYSKGGRMEELMKIHNRKKAAKIRHSFTWDKIPGKHDRKLRDFLMKNYEEIEWVKTAKIEKIDDNKTIMVAKDAKFVSIKLNDEKTMLNCKIDDGRNNEFLVRMENDELYPIKINNTPIKLTRRRKFLRMPQKKMSIEEQIKEIKKFLNSIGITGDMDKIYFEAHMDSGVEYNDNFDRIIEIVQELHLVEAGAQPYYWLENDFKNTTERLVDENNEKALESFEEELRNNFNIEEGFFFAEEGSDFAKVLNTDLLTSDICPNLGGHLEEKVVQPFVPSLDYSKMKAIIKILYQNKKPKLYDFDNRSITI